MSGEPEKERTCTVCGKPMKCGFCVDDGAEYYCSEECLHEKYTPEEYGKMYRENMAYWSEWED